MTDRETIDYQTDLIEKLFATCAMLTECSVILFSTDEEVGEMFKRATEGIASVASEPLELIDAYRAIIGDLDIKKVFLSSDRMEKVRFCFQLASTYHAVSKVSNIKKILGSEGDA
jgi:hypothetical protein